MVDAGQFVDGTDLDVRLLVSTLVGGVLIAFWEGVVEWIGNAGDLITTLLTTPFETYWEIFALQLGLVAEIPGTAWETAADWYGQITVLGPFVFPLVAITVAGSLLIAGWMFDRSGVY